MADLHPAYPKEGADHQDAHSRAPRNFPTMQNSSRENQVVHNFNEKDQEPETVGGKDPYTMSPNELRKYTK